MKMDPARTCPSCGNEFSGAIEFCPVCMLREAFVGGEAGSGVSTSGEVPVEATPEVLAERFENYEILMREDRTPVELGRGAMGVTYKAFDVDLRCPVALKVISGRYLNDESVRLRFLREARAASVIKTLPRSSTWGEAVGITSTRWNLWRGNSGGPHQTLRPA
jgi:hypothetical protein